jgi:hypothetical protein
VGGATSQVLRKVSASDYDTAWGNPAIADITGLQTALDAKQKIITSGTAAPTGGVDGDIYLQYT